MRVLSLLTGFPVRVFLPTSLRNSLAGRDVGVAFVALCGAQKMLILRCFDRMLIQKQEAECRAGRVSPR
jgi:hypothetical protein